MDSDVKYVTISIPKAVANEIDVLIGELGYWPSRSSFVREACIEKIRNEMLRLRELGRPVEELTDLGEKKATESFAPRHKRGEV